MADGIFIPVSAVTTGTWRPQRTGFMGGTVMQYRSRKFVTVACAAMAGVSITVLAASLAAAQYKMTVNKERLLNAANEPQNWLMMNGDYGSTRYSRLTQINRDNVKKMRLVWALALGACRTSARTDRKARSIRSSIMGSCTPATAGARSTRSTRATRTRVSS